MDGWDAWGITGKSPREVTGSVLALPLLVSTSNAYTYNPLHLYDIQYQLKFYVSRHVSHHSVEAIVTFSWTCTFSQHHDTCCPSVNPPGQKTGQAEQRHDLDYI